MEETIRFRNNEKLTVDHIARKLNLHYSIVSGHLVCAKLTRQEEIAERDEEPPIRHEQKALVDTDHLDIQKLRNFNQEVIRNASTGNRQKSANKAVCSQSMHVAIDDHSRYASESILADETAERVTCIVNYNLIDAYQEYASQRLSAIYSRLPVAEAGGDITCREFGT